MTDPESAKEDLHEQRVFGGKSDPQTRIRQLETENERLLDQIELLKEALVGLPAPLPKEWGLTGRQEDIFRVLVKRSTATHDALMAALYSDRVAPPDPKNISVQVLRMRRKLAPFGIKIGTKWGVGYELDAETRARFNTKAEQAAA